ncbi:MAG: SAM-dependent chlorinase/fluorinase [Cyanobacteria bacterium J06626_6]
MPSYLHTGKVLMITMLSDFGYQDSYVAVMKGVIAAIAPGKPTCDLTHAVPPQDILAARFNLCMAYPYFPRGTVHLAVVDPGVGSARRAIALQCPSGFFVAPDNGLLSGILAQEPPAAAISLTNSAYWRTPQPSQTFHGRDIFAPAAAHLANGVPITALGDRISPSSLIRLPLPPCQQHPAANSPHPTYAGSLQYIDGFGNLISNIPASAIPNSPWELHLTLTDQVHRLRGVKTYSQVPAGTLAALAGSHGWIEIACNGKSAAEALGKSATVGMAVSLMPQEVQ